jgi:hypothetical protein
MTDDDIAETTDIISHGGELIVREEGGWAVAVCVHTGNDGDHCYVLRNSTFVTVGEAKAFIDAGCPYPVPR